MMLICAACGHAGAHAVCLPAGEGSPRRCDSCPACRAQASAFDEADDPAPE
jgi:7-cyano-7-deazaguanine synthase in queuosine biosynthesis